MDNVKAEKAIAMRRYRRLHQLGLALRCIEVAAALLILTWSSTRLPAAAKSSGELLRAAIAGLVKPRAVFLIGNAIVIILFSGKLSSSSFSSSSKASTTSSTGGGGVGRSEIYGERWNWGLPELAATAAAVEEVVCVDKAVCVETPRRREYRRSRSEKVGKQRRETLELHRAESEIKSKTAAAAAEDVGDPSAGADDAEEFRRTIEAFIANQQKFRREESIAVVSSSTPRELPQ